MARRESSHISAGSKKPSHITYQYPELEWYSYYNWLTSINTYHHDKVTGYIRMHCGCYTFCEFWKSIIICIHHGSITIKHIFTTLKTLYSLCKPSLLGNHLFSICFFASSRRTCRNTQYVASSDWLFSLPNKHLKFFHALKINIVLLFGYSTVYLSICLLKNIVVASKFLASINKSAISIHMQVFVKT